MKKVLRSLTALGGAVLAVAGGFYLYEKFFKKDGEFDEDFEDEDLFDDEEEEADAFDSEEEIFEDEPVKKEEAPEEEDDKTEK